MLAAGAPNGPPNATRLPRHNVPLQAGGLHVSEQELDTDMEHAKMHVWAAVAARACASMQRARYIWLAPSTDSDSCSHLFCSEPQTVIRDRFLCFQFAENAKEFLISLLEKKR